MSGPLDSLKKHWKIFKDFIFFLTNPRNVPKTKIDIQYPCFTKKMGVKNNPVKLRGKKTRFKKILEKKKDL